MNDTVTHYSQTTCRCCRARTATWIVKDVGQQSYPVCDTCRRGLCCSSQKKILMAEARQPSRS